MEGLFGDNLGILYILGCVAVIGYTHFEENQHMFLLYIFTYMAAIFGVFRIAVCLGLLCAVTFAYLEYLTADKRKLSLIVKLRYKFWDYVFMMISQYHVLWILAAFVCLHISRYGCLHLHILRTAKLLSVMLLAVGLHRTISQPFKIKTFSEICTVFDENPPYMFQYTLEMQPRFDLLCAMEDRTYFQRKKTFSSFTGEYIVQSVKGRGRRVWELLVGFVLLRREAYHWLKRFLFARGHSTPEMQVIRTVGVQRGYDKYWLQRKLFEVIYSKIFFQSLKEFHQKNSCVDLDPHYRHYILSIHFKTAEFRIDKKKYRPVASYFEDPEDIASWSMEGVFVASYALSRWTMTNQRLAPYTDRIERFGLDEDKIWQIYRSFPEKKLPCDHPIKVKARKV